MDKINWSLIFERPKKNVEKRREGEKKKKRKRKRRRKEEQKGMESNIEYGLLGFLVWIHVCGLWVVRNLTLE